MTLEVFQREGILSDSESLEKDFLPTLLRANINRHHVASLGSVSRYIDIKNFLRLNHLHSSILTWNIPYKECSSSGFLNNFTLKKISCSMKWSTSNFFYMHQKVKMLPEIKIFSSTFSSFIYFILIYLFQIFFLMFL